MKIFFKYGLLISYICLLMIFAACSQKTTTEQNNDISLLDSANYIESIMKGKLSIETKSALRKIMNTKYFYLQKMNENSYTMSMIDNNKVKNFYFLFKNQRFYIVDFNGKDTTQTEIDFIGIQNFHIDSPIYFCFSTKSKETEGNYADCLYATSNNIKNNVMLWTTPENNEFLLPCVSEKYKYLFEKF